MLGWTPFSYPFNLTQQPAITVPCGLTSDGLPIGLQLVGPMFADGLVLRAAHAYEQLHPSLAPIPGSVADFLSRVTLTGVQNPPGPAGILRHGELTESKAASAAGAAGEVPRRQVQRGRGPAWGGACVGVARQGGHCSTDPPDRAGLQRLRRTTA